MQDQKWPVKVSHNNLGVDLGSQLSGSQLLDLMHYQIMMSVATRV